MKKKVIKNIKGRISPTFFYELHLEPWLELPPGGSTTVPTNAHTFTGIPKSTFAFWGSPKQSVYEKVIGGSGGGGGAGGGGGGGGALLFVNS